MMGMTFAQKQKKQLQEYLQIGFESGCQKYADLYGAALAMDGYGPERLYKLAVKVAELDAELGDAWGCGNESDVLQEKLDRILKKGYGERFQPFYARNEHIKKFNYKGRKA